MLSGSASSDGNQKHMCALDPHTQPVTAGPDALGPDTLDLKVRCMTWQ